MKALYERLAAEIPSPDLRFMNYGYLDPTAPRLTGLDPQDEPHRYHFNLLRRVLGSTTTRGLRVLEVGSGRGGNCDYLARYAGCREVWGVDRCVAHVAFCRRVYAHPALRFVAGSAEALPLRSASVDVVLNLESSHCYADFASFLAEVDRVLRPGGIFCFADGWGVRSLPIDWDTRERSLHTSPLRIVADDDLSEPVFLALKQDDGFNAELLAAGAVEDRGSEGPSPFIRQLVRGNEIMRLSLALAECSYRMVRMEKPAQ